jgi:DNA-binding transcriptional ArsR family regulator
MEMEPEFTHQHLEKGYQLTRAIVNPLRYRMLQFILQNTSVDVESIYTALNIDESTCSQQLRILREEGLITSERKGKQVIYSVSADKISNILIAVNSFFDKW